MTFQPGERVKAPRTTGSDVRCDAVYLGPMLMRPGTPPPGRPAPVSGHRVRFEDYSERLIELDAIRSID